MGHAFFAVAVLGVASVMSVKAPAFYVFKMFLPHHVANAKWMPSTLESEDVTGNGQTFPVISSAATVNDAGELSPPSGVPTRVAVVYVHQPVESGASRRLTHLGSVK